MPLFPAPSPSPEPLFLWHPSPSPKPPPSPQHTTAARRVLFPPGPLSLPPQPSSCLRLIEFSAWKGFGESRAELAGKTLLTRRVSSLKPCSTLPSPQRLLWNGSGVLGRGPGKKWSSSQEAAAPPRESPSRPRRLGWQPSALIVLG